VRPWSYIITFINDSKCTSYNYKVLPVKLVKHFDWLLRFQMAETVNTQLNNMSGDLKQIIEQMNQSNHSQDDSSPVSLTNINF